jgi:hypothetical protein
MFNSVKFDLKGQIDMKKISKIDMV